MAKEMTICNMTFEVTRRCNKRCNHCLRGEQENVDMTQKIAEKALKNVTAIDSLAFSGGEPTLNVETIRDIKDFIIRSEIQLGNFFIATNGTYYSEELVDTLYELYDYVAEQYGDMDLCALAISENQFQKPNASVVEKYSKLPFFKEYKNSIIPDDQILNTGLAYEHNIGTKRVEVCELDIDVSEQELNVNNGNVYINARGDVLPECDLSYKLQEEYKLGNVLEEDLINILEGSTR